MSKNNFWQDKKKRSAFKLLVREIEQMPEHCEVRRVTKAHLLWLVTHICRYFKVEPKYWQEVEAKAKAIYSQVDDEALDREVMGYFRRKNRREVVLLEKLAQFTKSELDLELGEFIFLKRAEFYLGRYERYISDKMFARYI